MISGLSPQRSGELLVLSSTLLWALFPSITVLSIETIPPILSAGLSMLAACILFSMILTARHQWGGVWAGKAMPDILVGTVLNGIIFHGIVFYALSQTTAGNAVIVFRMEAFFAFIILSLLIKHESFSARHFFGAVLMIFGACVIVNPQAAGSWQSGDWLILLATAIAPIGNFFQQRARKQVPAEHILLVRSLIAGAFLVCLSLLLEGAATVSQIVKTLPIILINGFCLLGLAKIFWVESLIRIPITKANSLATVVPFFGLIFAYLILGEVPTAAQLTAIVPMALGMLILIRKEK